VAEQRSSMAATDAAAGEVARGGLNLFLCGWAAFFRFGNSAKRFEKIRKYAPMRLALFISKRLRRSRGFGWSVVTYVPEPARAGHVVGNRR
jgi:Group II intron, maturase-specific domain